MDGLLIVDKPQGVSSAEVVRIVKRRLRCRTGHLGTLDPFASGVLPLCLGEGTKVAQFLNAADKEYTGIIRLGSVTDTGDPTGVVTATAAVPEPTAKQLENIAARFHGERLQTPPMYSALKRAGTPLYKLARQGIAVERDPRRVRIDRLELQLHAHGAIGLSVACSKGTYVRVLAQEIATSLGSVGHLETLRRTRFGPFSIAEAVTLDAFERGDHGTVLGLRESLRGVREIQLDVPAAARARRGDVLLLGHMPAGRLDELAKLVGPRGDLVAVMVMGHTAWRFARVFAQPRGDTAVAP
jgi:tRNA pseudouridine55 synthase